MPTEIAVHNLAKSYSISKFKYVLCMSQVLPQFGLIYFDNGCKFNVIIIFPHTVCISLIMTWMPRCVGRQKHTSDSFRAIMLSETIVFDEKPLYHWRWRPISKLYAIGTIRSAMNDNDLVWLVSPNWIALNKLFTNC